MSVSNELYNIIGKDYNATRQADPYLVNQLYDLLTPVDEGFYLDIGCGTGNYTISLAGKGIKFTGVEPSEKMLQEARLKSAGVDWLTGSAEKIPVRDDFFDGAIATLTIHHWNDLKTSFKELHRTLKINGRLILFTALPAQMRGYWLNHYFPEMIKKAADQMPAFETISSAAEEARFIISSTKKYEIKPDLQDLFLYSGKNNPTVYFDDAVRKGISSFATLANSIEITEGLQNLVIDVANGAFKKVKKRFENDLGDYLFIVLEKY